MIGTRYLSGTAEGEVWGRRTGTTGQWLLQDRQQSVREVLSQAGTLDGTITYDAFGRITGESNPGVSGALGYTGLRRDDPGGLWWARWRTYDADVGQWLQEDPISFSAGDPNIRRYVGNDATNKVDPSGLEEKEKRGFFGRAWHNLIYPALEGAVEGATDIIVSGNPVGQFYLLANDKHPTQKLYGVGKELAKGEFSSAVDMGWNILKLSTPVDATYGNWVRFNGLFPDDKSDEIRAREHQKSVGQVAGGALLLVGGISALEAGVSRTLARSTQFTQSAPTAPTGTGTLSRGAELRATYGEVFGEYMHFRNQGFSPAQARYLTQPYQGKGHHFPIPQRTARSWGLPDWLRDSQFNVLSPSGISRGRFYELHYMVDPHFHGAAFPRSIGGSWRGGQLGLERYSPWTSWWHATPGPTKVVGGVVIVGGGAAGGYRLFGGSDEE